VPAPQQLEYFLLQYAPNLLSDEHINVGVVLWMPSDLPNGFCTARFSSSWRVRVKNLSQKEDLILLAALFEDIERCLASPESRVEMLAMMQDSFSNMIRVSEIQKCVSQDPAMEIETIVARYL